VAQPVMKVEGARQLRATLKAAGDDLGDLKDAHREAGTIVANAAGGRAPRRTGALAGSIRAAGTKAGAVVRAGGARAPYAPYVHNGTPARGIPQNPFITEAAQATESRWVAGYGTAIERIVDKVKGA
jgi:hypothetical protein